MREFFGLDDDWVRPLPAKWLRRDALIALFVFVNAVLGIEVMRSLGGHIDWPRPVVYGVLALGSIPLAWRRRYPLTVMLLLAAHMFVTGVAEPLIMSSLTMQVTYFFTIFTALAWGRDRRVTLYVSAGLLVFMFGWVAVQLAVSSMRDELVSAYMADGVQVQDAIFGPFIAAMLYAITLNLLFFVTAVMTGANSWRGARQQARAESQARTIEAQADRLTEQAVVDERLRIARELHDVVAHHVAAIGIQAAASRKLMAKDPALAAQSLTNVEASSRDAVTQMRSLLGTLRTGGSGTGDPAVEASETDVARRPEPSLGEVSALIENVRATGLDVVFSDLTGDLDVPGSLGHSIYRTVQEALANVRRHSTATSASVALRQGGEGRARYIEAEILDDGRARQGTSGSGLGLMGMRERVTAHRGSAEIGPRLTGGYRVRVRFPLRDSAGVTPGARDVTDTQGDGRTGTE